MRILHVITSLRTGGAEKLIQLMTPRLVQAGNEVEVALLDGTDTYLKQALTKSGVRVHSLSNGGSVYNPIHIIRLRKLIRRFDIIHTHNTSPQFFVALANIGLKTRLVTTEHNTYNRRRKIPGFALIDAWMYRRYSHIICISEKAEQNLRQFINNQTESISTIHNGIDLDNISQADPIAELEEIAPGSKKILMVAGFRPQKDQDTIIRALKFLPEKFHFFMAGDGERHDELVRLTQNEKMTDRVHFLGVRSDIPSLLKSVDYIVMSSHYEGLSLSSVEGMAAGKPFIASDVDGLREVVENAGILFEHGNPKDLADRIIEIDNDSDLNNTIALTCHNRAKEYDIKAMTQHYLKIYQQIYKSV